MMPTAGTAEVLHSMEPSRHQESQVNVSEAGLRTFCGAAAFGHCMGSVQPVHSLDLPGER